MKLDIGCGTKKTEGYTGVDKIAFPGVDVVLDVASGKWPWDDGSVDEVFCSHMVEHLTAQERIHFANELGRVLKKGGKATIITPHWSAGRAYGDLTHQWPPVAESWFYHLNAAWRLTSAPHEQFYTCDFDHTLSYSVAPHLQARNMEYQIHALTHFKEAAMDLMATMTKR